MTVRFPSGFSVQYNDANYLSYMGVHPNQAIRLTTARENGKWICDIPVSSGAIVEVAPPCRTYNANTTDDGKVAQECLRRIRSLSVYDLAELKKALAGFDAKRKAWKE